MPGLCRAARPGTVWGPLAAQEKRDLRVVETDYSRYAIVHQLQQRGHAPSAALQLLGGCRDGGWAPTAPGGGDGQGLGSPPPACATTLAPNMLAPGHPATA